MDIATFPLAKWGMWISFVVFLQVISSEGLAQIGCTDAPFGSYALNPEDPTCQSFIRCMTVPKFHTCPGNLVFDPRFNVCNYRWAAPCVLANGGLPTTTVPSTTTTQTRPVTTTPTTTSSTTTTTIAETTTPTTPTTTTTPPTVQPEQTTAPPVQVTTNGPIQSEPESNVDPCSLPGAQAFYPDRQDCSFYIVCNYGKGLRRFCSKGLVWNQQNFYCDWPSNVDCDRRSDQIPDDSNNGDGDKGDGNNGDGNNGDGSNTPGNDGDDNGSDNGIPEDNQDGNGIPGNNGESTGENQDNTDNTLPDVTYPPYTGNSSDAGDCQRIVCYFTNWAQYRPGNGKFSPENIVADHCTHIIYAFAKLRGNRLAPFEWNDDSTSWMTGMYARVMKLKTANPALKVLLAVGGWNFGSGPFTRMVATESNRQEFVETSITFLRERNFDGLDLDWEYPANRGSPASDRDRFSYLIKELRQAFETEARTSGSPRLLLAAAVSAGKTTIDKAYDIPELAKHLDFANLMSYDLHGAWDSFTGHNSPLYPGPWEFRAERYLNVDWAARYWVRKGFPRQNLVVGVPFYGRTFTLAGPNSQIKAPARGAGAAGRFTREMGFVSYYEVCEYLQASSTIRRRIDEMRVPYLVRNGNEWIGYDDPQSLTTKVEYIIQNSYGGVMIWSIAMDDFRGTFCGQGKYPLMRTVRQACGLPE